MIDKINFKPHERIPPFVRCISVEYQRTRSSRISLSHCGFSLRTILSPYFALSLLTPCCRLVQGYSVMNFTLNKLNDQQCSRFSTFSMLIPRGCLSAGRPIKGQGTPSRRGSPQVQQYRNIPGAIIRDGDRKRALILLLGLSP